MLDDPDAFDADRNGIPDALQLDPRSCSRGPAGQPDARALRSVGEPDARGRIAGITAPHRGRGRRPPIREPLEIRRPTDSAITPDGATEQTMLEYEQAIAALQPRST